jgi:hypothetical protein
MTHGMRNLLAVYLQKKFNKKPSELILQKLTQNHISSKRSQSKHNQFCKFDTLLVPNKMISKNHCTCGTACQELIARYQTCNGAEL